MMRARAICFAAALLSAAPVLAQSQTPPSAVVDPARLAVATRIIDKMLPEGSYRKIMTPVLNSAFSQMANTMISMPIRQFARSAGIDDSQIQKLGPDSIKELVEILDPAFQQRTTVTFKVMSTRMIDIMSDMEPEFRQTYARVYARNFDLKQLSDIEQFFSTPTGAAYATRQLTVVSDPEVLQQSQALVPKMVEQMPELMKRVEAETASLPKPRKASELSSAEKSKIAQLMGIDPAKVK